MCLMGRAHMPGGHGRGWREPLIAQPHLEIAVTQRLLEIVENDTTSTTTIEAVHQLLCTLLHILVLHAHAFQHQLEIGLMAIEESRWSSREAT